ncbi:hypothetical protein FACS189472_09780 [Alphaproteobacteria bacterium]|nr:hypothetical protein FACS189472_09780 [Alphaproteobacteria bacterium]
MRQTIEVINDDSLSIAGPNNSKSSSEEKKKKKETKIKYEFVNELPKGSRKVLNFNDWDFDNLYYNDGDFYTKVNNSYRKLAVLGDKSKRVNTYDINNKYRGITLNKFTKELKNWNVEFEKTSNNEIEEDKIVEDKTAEETDS